MNPKLSKSAQPGARPEESPPLPAPPWVLASHRDACHPSGFGR